MRRIRTSVLFLLLVAVLYVAGSAIGAPHVDAGSPILITPVNPLPGSEIHSATPNISATFTDPAAPIDVASVFIHVDTLNITGLDQVSITPKGFNYAVPSILHLSPGNHTVAVSVSDQQGNHAEYSWGFNVNLTALPANPLFVINPQLLLFDVALGAALVGAGVGGYLLYLRRAKRFTFRRYFATHPVKKQYLVLYLPVALAFVFVLVGLLYVYNSPGFPSNAPDYVYIGGIFVALTAYAIETRRERTRQRAYERAFAQFLFEMSDAMRGGIDPAKTLIELAKTQSNILAKHLRIAADGIRIGRPFDQVIKNMVEPMRSPLVTRYAVLIADAATVGGETSAVVYRAAKDMDDFIKIEVERSQQLAMPVAILYISFGVLMAVLFSLLNIAPSLGSINVGLFGFGSTNPLAATGATAVPKLDISTLRERFFDLMIINSVGTGVIIGAFTEGKARFGLIHSLVLVGATTVAFALFAH